jgi:hypothetical protein
VVLEPSCGRWHAGEGLVGLRDGDLAEWQPSGLARWGPGGPAEQIPGGAVGNCLPRQWPGRLVGSSLMGLQGCSLVGWGLGGPGGPVGKGD